MPQAHCSVHSATVAIAHCARCSVAMCDACFRFLTERAPVCVRCAHEQATRSRRRVSLSVFAVLVSLAGGGLYGRSAADSADWLFIALGVLLVAAASVWMARAGTADTTTVAELRERREDDDWNDAQAPKTGGRAQRRRRALAMLVPSISGRLTALITIACMLVTALLFPRLLDQPRWIEVEATLLLWWLGVSAGLWIVLHRALHVEDDHYFHAPHRVGIDTVNGCSDFGGCSPDFAPDDACAVALAPLVALVFALVAVFAAWLVVEVLVPITFVTFYVVTLAAIRRATRDRHDCHGNLARSLRWAMTWATFYLAPVAVLVWLMHMLALKS